VIAVDRNFYAVVALLKDCIDHFMNTFMDDDRDSDTDDLPIKRDRLRHGVEAMHHSEPGQGTHRMAVEPE